MCIRDRVINASCPGMLTLPSLGANASEYNSSESDTSCLDVSVSDISEIMSSERVESCAFTGGGSVTF